MRIPAGLITRYTNTCFPDFDHIFHSAYRILENLHVRFNLYHYKRNLSSLLYKKRENQFTSFPTEIIRYTISHLSSTSKTKHLAPIRIKHSFQAKSLELTFYPNKETASGTNIFSRHIPLRIEIRRIRIHLIKKIIYFRPKSHRIIYLVICEQIP